MSVENAIDIKACAKINFSIDILGTRTDGYHEISTIMQTVPIYDDIRIEAHRPESQESRICMKSVNAKLPSDMRNSACRAASIILDRFSSIRSDICITIDKAIPIGGGLGGSSSDAAGVIEGMNELFSLGLDTDKMLSIGAEAGSDVPFLIKKGTCLATGTGHVLKDLTPFNRGYLLIVNPGILVSTKTIYDMYDSMNVPCGCRPDNERLVKLLSEHDFTGFAAGLRNVLESPAFRMYPSIEELKNDIAETGAMCSVMSGSGSSVYGIYGDLDKAREAEEILSKRRYEGSDKPTYTCIVHLGDQV